MKPLTEYQEYILAEAKRCRGVDVTEITNRFRVKYKGGKHFPNAFSGLSRLGLIRVDEWQRVEVIENGELE